MQRQCVLEVQEDGDKKYEKWPLLCNICFQFKSSVAAEKLLNLLKNHLYYAPKTDARLGTYADRLLQLPSPKITRLEAKGKKKEYPEKLLAAMLLERIPVSDRITYIEEGYFSRYILQALVKMQSIDLKGHILGLLEAECARYQDTSPPEILKLQLHRCLNQQLPLGILFASPRKLLGKVNPNKKGSALGRIIQLLVKYFHENEVDLVKEWNDSASSKSAPCDCAASSPRLFARAPSLSLEPSAPPAPDEVTARQRISEELEDLQLFWRAGNGPKDPEGLTQVREAIAEVRRRCGYPTEAADVYTART